KQQSPHATTRYSHIQIKYSAKYLASSERKVFFFCNRWGSTLKYPIWTSLSPICFLSCSLFLPFLLFFFLSFFKRKSLQSLGFNTEISNLDFLITYPLLVLFPLFPSF